MVINSASTTSKNLFPVRVVNLKPTDLWLKPNMRIGLIREVNCVFDQNSEVKFFKTGENEESIVRKASLDENQINYPYPWIFWKNWMPEKVKNWAFDGETSRCVYHV